MGWWLVVVVLVALVKWRRWVGDGGGNCAQVCAGNGSARGWGTVRVWNTAQIMAGRPQPVHCRLAWARAGATHAQHVHAPLWPESLSSMREKRLPMVYGEQWWKGGSA